MNALTGSDRPDLSGQFAGFADIITPRVVVSESLLTANIARMAAILSPHVALHPHMKTHKSLEIARRQLAAGAKGLTASRPGEASVFIRAGLAPVTVAYPLVRPEPIVMLGRLAEESGVDVRFIVDSEIGADALETAASTSGLPARAFLKVDVGLHRVGIDPLQPASVHLAERIARSPVELLGLLSHAGQAYAAPDIHGVREVAQREREILLAFRDKLAAVGVATPTISVGSTPTVIANAGFDGIDEVRPGNYAFLDLSAMRLGLAARAAIALAVAATVISVNDTHAIIDAGSKVLSSDLGPHSAARVTTYGEAWLPDRPEPLDVVRLSEEHGFVAHRGKRPAIGSKLLILPNHACPVINLAAEFTLLTRQSPITLPVDARDVGASSLAAR